MSQPFAVQGIATLRIHYEQSIDIKANPNEVFAFMDDIHNTGWHMEKSSMPMMGSRMEVEVLSKNSNGLGATYRWTGRVLGLPLDFSETVVTWLKGKERVWRTIGEPKIIIMGHYEMSFKLRPVLEGTNLTVSIDYELPKAPFWKFVGWLLAGWYSKWCLNNMCKDAKAGLEN